MPFIVPWQGHKEFKIIQKSTVISKSGAIGKTKVFKPTGKTIKGMLSQIGPNERETYKQNGYEVSHTLVSFGGPRLKQNDFLYLEEEDRIFRVETDHNHAEIDHFTAYRLNERKDLQYGSESVSATDGDQGQE